MSSRHTPNPDDIDDRLEAVVERVGRLENRLGLSTTTPNGSRISFEQLLALGLTRRQALAALGFVAAGATTAAAVSRSIGTVQPGGDEDDEADDDLQELDSLRASQAEVNNLAVGDDGEIRRLEAIDAAVVPRYESEEEMLDLTDRVGSVGLIETHSGKAKLKWRTEDT
jgi:uroporphyrinogen-III synthase